MCLHFSPELLNQSEPNLAHILTGPGIVLRRDELPPTPRLCATGQSSAPCACSGPRGHFRENVRKVGTCSPEELIHFRGKLLHSQLLYSQGGSAPLLGTDSHGNHVESACMQKNVLSVFLQYRLQAFYEFCNFYGFLLHFLLLPFKNFTKHKLYVEGAKIYWYR